MRRAVFEGAAAILMALLCIAGIIVGPPWWPAACLIWVGIAEARRCEMTFSDQPEGDL